MKQTTYFGIFMAALAVMVYVVPAIADTSFDGSVLLSVAVAVVCLAVMNVCFFKGKLWDVSEGRKR